MLAFLIYGLPVPVTLIMVIAWYLRVGSTSFALFVILLPLLYGYIIPGIGTNIQKKWRFRGRFLVGNYFIHHGFLYAAEQSMFLYLCFGDVRGSRPLTWTEALTIIFSTGVCSGFFVWLLDVYLIKNGALEVYNRRGKAGRPAEEVAMMYAPACFFAIGCSHAAACLLAYEFIVVRHQVGAGTFTWLLLTGMALLTAFLAAAYGLLENR